MSELAAKSPTELLFDQKGDFKALHAAQAWCDKHGVSFGSTERGRPVGLLVGDYAISKWTRMDTAERAALDGTLEGDMRAGPIRLRLKAAALGRLAVPFETGP